MKTYKCSLQQAASFVFIYSALIHEAIVMIIFGDNDSFYIFHLMISQIFLIQITWMTRGTKFGILIFWFG